MTDYTKLTKALRCCIPNQPETCEGCTYNTDGEWECNVPGMMVDAAAAIEALNRLLDQNTQRCEELRKQLREAHESYERHLNDLEAEVKRLKLSCADCEYGNSPWPEEPVHEPKRGEMKNADKIRAMSDEELARWVVDEGRYFGEEYEGYMSCLDWLKEEVQE